MKGGLRPSKTHSVVGDLAPWPLIVVALALLVLGLFAADPTAPERHGPRAWSPVVPHGRHDGGRRSSPSRRLHRGSSGSGWP